MLTTTLKQLKEYDACKRGLDTLINSLPNIQETDPIPLSHILESNGLDHVIWSLRTQGKQYSVEFAVQCAEHVLSVFESEFPEDKRPRNAIEAAKKYLKDPSEENRLACRDAARAAADAADAAYAAGAACVVYYAAADAACVVYYAAADAADAARAAGAAGAAGAAARAAASAASAADAAARAATRAAADAAEIEFQKQLFLKIVS